MDIKGHKVLFKKLTENAILPSEGTEFSAGLDLYIKEDIAVKYGQILKIGTGLACEIEEGYFGLIAMRSSCATKNALIIAGGMGIIDSDYRGEIFITITFLVPRAELLIVAGTALAQMIITPYIKSRVVETATLSKTNRGEGGFGSTDKE